MQATSWDFITTENVTKMTIGNSTLTPDAMGVFSLPWPREQLRIHGTVNDGCAAFTVLPMVDTTNIATVVNYGDVMPIAKVAVDDTDNARDDNCLLHLSLEYHGAVNVSVSSVSSATYVDGAVLSDNVVAIYVEVYNAPRFCAGHGKTPEFTVSINGVVHANIVVSNSPPPPQVRIPELIVGISWTVAAVYESIWLRDRVKTCQRMRARYEQVQMLVR